MENQISSLDLRGFIRNIPDFPKEGILFRDITTLLDNKNAFSQVINALAEPYRDKKIDCIVAVETRGFILGGGISL